MDLNHSSKGSSPPALGEANGSGTLDPGLSARIVGLVASLCRHVLDLGSLAAEEARNLIRQSLVILILSLGLIFAIAVAYLAMIATGISLLIFSHGWGWAAAFGAVSLGHLVLALILIGLGGSPRWLRFSLRNPPNRVEWQQCSRL